MAFLPGLVKSLAAFDVFAMFKLSAPMVVGMVLAMIGGVMLTLLGSISAKVKSDEEKQREVDGVVVKHYAEDFKKSLGEIVQEMSAETGIPGLLNKLDALDTTAVKDIYNSIDEIFSKFDTDKNGVLEGNEYQKCIDELLEHMKKETFRELRRSCEKLCPGKPEAEMQLQWSKVNFKKMRSWIVNVMDPNADGKITKIEAQQGFKKVVDVIEKEF